MAASKVEKPVKLTKRLMNQYRESLISEGLGKQTISMYFCYLNRLYGFLKGDREITEEGLDLWVSSLKEKGFSDRTINLHISSVNGLLRFCGQDRSRVSVITVPRSAKLPELTRAEYLSLLSYVKAHGSERDYLLIKTLATIDISVTDLPCLTVKACQTGTVECPHNREAVIPDSFRQELLSYIEGQGISGGPVFVTAKGGQLDRSNITHLIEWYGTKAGIDRKKANPRALHSLYERTREEITQRLMGQRMQEYERLLEEEQSH